MHSVKIKIITLVLVCIILSSSIIGGSSIVNAKNVVADDSVKIMNLLCEKRADEINALFLRIEQSVETLAVYATQQVGDFEKFKTSDEYVEEYSKKMFNVAVNAAQTTEGAMMVYLRYNPQFTSATSGVFCAVDSKNMTYTELVSTDILKYDKNDFEHVGWYWQPVENGEGTWIAPYYNLNTQMDTISYVVPYYIKDELVGIVGMDIDLERIENIVAETSLYETGYAFLTNSRGEIVYHNKLDRGTNLFLFNYGEFSDLIEILTSKTSNENELLCYTFQSEKREAAFRSLVNGMSFVVTAPVSEIDKRANSLMLGIIITILSILIVAVFFTIFFTKKLVKPLLELTTVSKRIASGDLSVTIAHHSKDEVGILAESFRQTVQHLNTYIKYINELAYRDSLTGVKSKTAYTDMVAQLDAKLCRGDCHYAVVVFDINGLKIVNDTQGHDFGDVLIVNSSRIICGVFKQSPVYRIGGDEFVAILDGIDYTNADELLKQFQHKIDEHNNNPENGIKVSIASGLAIYSKETDESYHDVFRRADNNMYSNKADIKQKQKNR